MKTFVLFLITVLIFSFSNIYSQWIYQNPPLDADYYISIDFPGSQIGITGGALITPDFSGKGAYTTNGGANWQSSLVPDSLRVMVDIAFINSTTGYCAGAYNLTPSDYPFSSGKYDKRTLQLINKTDNLSGNNYKGLFLRSTNSGQTWNSYGTLPANVFYMLGLSFINLTTGYAIGSLNISGGVNDGVLKTTNAGLNWSVLTLPENINLFNDIYFSDLNNGYAVGYDLVNDTNRGVILKTTNAGVSWTRQVIMQVNELSSISFANATTGLAVSISSPVMSVSGSSIYKTTNAGVNWALISIFDNVDIYDVSFVQGSGIALVSGTRLLPSSGFVTFIAKTVNYGSNWTQGTINDTGMVIFGAKLIDQNNWYLTGGNFGSVNSPVILHTTNGGSIGIEPIGTEVPSSYSLSQNYPNPFNPVTKIRFAISGTSAALTYLSVYDILGREVEMLVNDELSPGIYEVDFNASKLTSGVYFYRLTTEKFTETKRMLLVK